MNIGNGINHVARSGNFTSAVLTLESGRKVGSDRWMLVVDLGQQFAVIGSK